MQTTYHLKWVLLSRNELRIMIIKRCRGPSKSKMQWTKQISIQFRYTSNVGTPKVWLRRMKINLRTSWRQFNRHGHKEQILIKIQKVLEMARTSWIFRTEAINWYTPQHCNSTISRMWQEVFNLTSKTNKTIRGICSSK